MDLACRQALLMLFVLLPVRVITQDCIYKECLCDGVSIVCQARGLTRIPTMMTSELTNFTTLILDNNAISEIPAGSLPPNLTEIDLVQNPTSSIDHTAFDSSANTLQTLIFTRALLTRIPDVFLHLRALKTLTIYDTKIDDWNEKAMENIGRTVTTLSLENVSISSWPTWIKHFSQVSEMTLANGSIVSLPDDALENMTNTLITLDLSDNRLTTVPKALSKLTALRWLFLQNNKIRDVTWLPQASQVSLLSLSNNQISDANLLSHVMLPYGESLADLAIQNNLLTAFPNFSFLTQVESFDFSDNKISDPRSGSVPALITFIYLNHNSLPAIPRFMPILQMVSHLMLSWNAIREIHGTDFPQNANNIDLGFNLISELTDTSFPENSQIENLNLNNNPIITISNLAFENLHRLIELNLRNTRLTRLPLALLSLTSLSVLDMTGSQPLVCTCMENSLDGWILSKTSYHVLGKCGQMSIYDFFAKLSSGCP